MSPDVVFVATGSVAQVPQGDDSSDVAEVADVDLLMIDDVLEHGTAQGGNVLVVGGDQIGMQAADYLSEGGRQVWVAESHGHFAHKLAANDRWYLIARTMQKNVRALQERARYPHRRGRPRGSCDRRRHRDARRCRHHRLRERAPVGSRARRESPRARGLETYVIGDAADVNREDSGTILADDRAGVRHRTQHLTAACAPPCVLTRSDVITSG